MGECQRCRDRAGHRELSREAVAEWFCAELGSGVSSRHIPVTQCIVGAAVL